MSGKRILITGASGFVGQGLATHFAAKGWSVVGAGRKAISFSSGEYFSIDLATDSSASEKLIEQSGPDLIVHSAGVKDVRWCETHEAEAYRINAEAAEWLAVAARRKNIPLVLISTDLVFAADRGSYAEDAETHPTSVYGKSKLAGEQRVFAAHPQVMVCRTGGVYGQGSPLLRWLKSELSAQKKIDAFADVKNTPTYLPDLAELVERLAAKGQAGLFHTCGSEVTNRFQWFREFAAAFGFSPELVQPAEAKGRYQDLSLFPDSSLVSEKAYALTGYRASSIGDSFRHLAQLGGP